MTNIKMSERSFVVRQTSSIINCNHCLRTEVYIEY